MIKFDLLTIAPDGEVSVFIDNKTIPIKGISVIGDQLILLGSVFNHYVRNIENITSSYELFDSVSLELISKIIYVTDKNKEIEIKHMYDTNNGIVFSDKNTVTNFISKEDF